MRRLSMILLLVGLHQAHAQPGKPDAAIVARVIARFRSETLQVATGARSSVSIGSAVAYNGYTSFFNMHRWSATASEGSTWIVTVRGKAPRGAPDSASWSYDTTRSAVTPLDTYAEKLALRQLRELDCLKDAPPVAKRAQVTQLMILPLPAPPQVKPYRLQASFFVPVSGRAVLLEWNEPNDPEYARNVFETLRYYKLIPARTQNGDMVCSTTFIRASVGL